MAMAWLLVTLTTNRIHCPGPSEASAADSIPLLPIDNMSVPPPADERPLVMLAQPLFPEFAAALAGRYRFALLADADAAAAAEARALLVGGLPSVTAQHLDALPALELVACTSVGVDHVDLDACRSRGLSVTNAGVAFAADSADYAVGLLIAVLRRVAAADAYVRSGRWTANGDYPLTTKVSGKRVGIVGLGNIGSRVARRLAVFGCAVSYHSRSPKPSVPYPFVPALRDLAAGSDVLVLSCALTDETKHMVNREVMEALGKGGVLVNVGRGGLVDEPELVRCLRKGVIGGAGLDVYENEPAVPPELLGMDNVVLSDHRAVLTPESIGGVLEVVIANLDAFFSGRPLNATFLEPIDDTVLVPFPAQGHVTPMMKLAKVLHRNGFHVTFVNTEYNQRRLVRSRGPGAVAGLPGFRFATIPDGIPTSDADADADSTQDPTSLCYYTMTTCLPHLKSLLRDLNGAVGAPPVSCVVGDGVMSFCVDAAADLGVPCALFWTASACGFMGYRNFRFLLDEGLTPLKDEEQVKNGYLDTPVRQAHGMSKHMRLRDFPSFVRTTDRGDVLFNFLLHEVEQSDRATANILNTFEELEQTALDAMRAILPLPVYTIGPLNFLTEQLVSEGDLAGIRSSLWREDQSCLEWLQGREPRSVVYVNYGSVTTMSKQELVEFAWGLANCGYDFLWIVRNDLVKGDAAVLPPEFLEATKGRCLLASWCEQEAVMRHEAVGAFLTHCGWNSMMEGLSAGLPMLCWPFFAEQQTNSRYACVEWGVGMEVGDDVRREVVDARIREVMGGEVGREMRRAAAEWKEVASRSTAQHGGRSLANLESLLKDVLK